MVKNLKPQPDKNESINDFVKRTKEIYTNKEATAVYVAFLKKNKKTDKIILK